MAPAKWFSACLGLFRIETVCSVLTLLSQGSLSIFVCLFVLFLSIFRNSHPIFGYLLQFNVFIPGFSFLVPQSLVMFSQIPVLLRCLKYFFQMLYLLCNSHIISSLFKDVLSAVSQL